MKKTPETIEKAAEPVAEKAAETVVEQASKPVTEKAAETAAKPKAAKAKKQPAAKAAPQKTEDIFVRGEWNVSELAERAKAAYLAEGHRAASIKKLCLYVKPEDGKAYYVVNDKAAGNIEL